MAKSKRLWFCASTVSRRVRCSAAVEIVKHIHPFPARMAPELVFEMLPGSGTVDVLDPMMGSGTTLVSARMKGHRATGIDRDPLAVLVSGAATRDLDEDAFVRDATNLLERARIVERRLSDGQAYPLLADDETKRFIRYWFDRRSRRQLTAITWALAERPYRTKRFLKTAVSRMIVTKQGGVSLAEDISHSRPHRTRDVAPNAPFDLFPRSVSFIIRNTSFRGRTTLPRARVLTGDCRALPFADQSFDYVITSPPYLKAIDYLRGHKLSLVWFNYRISSLMNLRGTNVGSNRGLADDKNDRIIEKMVSRPECLSRRNLNMLRLYLCDLEKSVEEMSRVLRARGRAFFVIGDCIAGGVSVKNSYALQEFSEMHGLVPTRKALRRMIPVSKRYLPPPGSAVGSSIGQRMWAEVILALRAG